MANQIPFSGASSAAGGYLLPVAQGALLTNGLLRENGALSLAGDARTTTSRSEAFTIWLGTPTAAFVGEGAVKPVTGGELGTATMNVKKVASIVMFTDEMRQDVINGDLDVLADSGVRSAINNVIDQSVTGWAAGVVQATSFDNMWRSTTQTVEYVQATADGLRRAVSDAMALLEANGYGDPGQMGLLLPGDSPAIIRNARSTVDTTEAIYTDRGIDPFYGIQRATSTNLPTIAGTAAAGRDIGYLVYRPNVHVRIRQDVTVDYTNVATVHDGTTLRNMWQENLSAFRYETRLACFTHDLNRAVVAIRNAV